MVEGRALAVGVAGDVGGVFAALSTAYDVHAEPMQALHWTWLDTADWRLHRAGLALREERLGRTRQLVVDRPGRPPVSSPVSGVSWPARLERLAPSDVRSALADVVGVRALLPVAEVDVRRILLRLRDDAAKTRVRVSVEQQRLVLPRKAALPLHVEVRALRGYDADARRCVDLLGAAMSAQVTTLSPTDAALAAADRRPGADDESRVAVTGADPAVRPVAHTLLGHVRTVDEARDGALADLDTEYLHDLRTAIRSTRALLAAAGDLLPGRSAVRVERDLAWLDEMTAPLRAVDIALLVIGAAAPDVEGTEGDELDLTCLGGGLEPLREQLRRRRRNELRRMRAALRAPRAPAAFTAWRADLGRMLDADLIGPSVAESAGERVDRTYRALVAAPADDVAFRVASLREVLRTFGSAYVPDVAAKITAELAQAHELLRVRDGMRITRTQIADAAGAGALPTTTVLAAGALLDRARLRESVLDGEIADRVARIGDLRFARRIGALTS